MDTDTLIKDEKKTLYRAFGIKTYAEVLEDLKQSRAEYERGEYEDARVVIKELHARYGRI